MRALYGASVGVLPAPLALATPENTTYPVRMIQALFAQIM